MNQTRQTNERIWQGMVAALLLVLVMFSEAIIGSDAEPQAAQRCEGCVVAVSPLRALP